MNKYFPNYRLRIQSSIDTFCEFCENWHKIKLGSRFDIKSLNATFPRRWHVWPPCVKNFPSLSQFNSLREETWTIGHVTPAVSWWGGNTEPDNWTSGHRINIFLTVFSLSSFQLSDFPLTFDEIWSEINTEPYSEHKADVFMFHCLISCPAKWCSVEGFCASVVENFESQVWIYWTRKIILTDVNLGKPVIQWFLFLTSLSLILPSY